MRVMRAWAVWPIGREISEPAMLLSSLDGRRAALRTRGGWLWYQSVEMG